MEISLKSTFYLGINVVIGAASLYKTPYPYHWLTGFAAGLLAGTFVSSYPLSKAKNGYVPGNNYGMGGDQQKDDEVRAEGIAHFANMMPGFVMTAINAVALAIITKAVQTFEPYGSRYESAITAGSAFTLGHTLGNLFSLDLLRRSKAPELEALLDDLVL